MALIKSKARVKSAAITFRCRCVMCRGVFANNRPLWMSHISLGMQSEYGRLFGHFYRVVRWKWSEKTRKRERDATGRRSSLFPHGAFVAGTKFVSARYWVHVWALWKKRHKMMDINEADRALIMQRETCFCNFIAAFACMLKSFWSCTWEIWVRLFHI